MNPRIEAARLLERVFVDDAYANRLLDASLSRGDWNPQDKGLLTELVYGVLRRLQPIDAMLDRLARKGIRSIDESILNHLRVAMYQLMYLDRIPPHAAVSEAVNAVRDVLGPKVGGFANGLLRSFLRDDKGWKERLPKGRNSRAIAMRTSHPEWMVKRFMEQLGPEGAEERLEAHNRTPLLTLRVNRGWGSRDDLLRVLRDEGFEVEPTCYSSDGLRLLKSGGKILRFLNKEHPTSFAVQDEAAQLMGEWLEPKDGEVILDSCAAPGAKTTHLAGLAPGAEVVGNDIYEHKLRLIEKASERLGLQNIKTQLSDASQPLSGQYDRILCDAPCSGLGTLQRHPEIRYRRDDKELFKFARTQLSILAQLAPALKPGGVLVYSVCTDTREENEGVVERFLKKHPDFELDTTIPEHWKPLQTEEGYLKTSPTREEMDAFFAARFVKKQVSEES